MKTLVHPYIEDISIMHSAGRKGSSVISEVKPQVKLNPEESPAPVIKEDVSGEEPNGAAEQYPAEEESSEPATVEETEPKPEISEESEPEKDYEHNIEFEFYDEGNEDTAEFKQEISDEIEQDSQDLFFMPEAADEPQNKPKKGRGLNITILIVCVLLLLAVFAICYFLIFLPLVGGVSTSEYFKEIFSTATKV